MDLRESIFWMNGRLATNCVEISEDPNSLDKDGFWVVVKDFEGKFVAARFENVIESELPKVDWKKLNSYYPILTVEENQWQANQNSY
jgi:para-aminobenzoate synthetase component 1